MCNYYLSILHFQHLSYNEREYNAVATSYGLAPSPIKNDVFPTTVQVCVEVLYLKSIRTFHTHDCIY